MANDFAKNFKKAIDKRKDEEEQREREAAKAASKKSSSGSSSSSSDSGSTFSQRFAQRLKEKEEQRASSSLSSDETVKFRGRTVKGKLTEEDLQPVYLRDDGSPLRGAEHSDYVSSLSKHLQDTEEKSGLTSEQRRAALMIDLEESRRAESDAIRRFESVGDNDEDIKMLGQIASEAAERRKSIENQLKELDFEDKYSTKTYDDNFFGQAAASFTVGNLSEKSNKAWYDYLQDPSEENRWRKDLIDTALQKFQTNNEATLADDATLPWVSQSLAGYLPQLGRQIGYSAAGGAMGGTAGAVAGSVVPGLGTAAGAIYGIKGGITAGSGLYSYQSMRGAAFRELVNAGMDEETAMKASNDEAVLSAIIEMGDTAFDIATLGGGKLIKSLLSEGVESAVKNSGKKRLLKALGGYGLNIAGEMGEEGMQEAVSIANANRGDTGILNLTGESVNTLWEAAHNTDSDNWKQIWGAAKEGGKIAAMMGGAQGAVNFAANEAVTRQRGSAVNAEGDVSVQQLIEMALETEEGTESREMAEQMQTRYAAGEDFSNREVGKLYNATVDSVSGGRVIRQESIEQAPQQTAEQTSDGHTELAKAAMEMAGVETEERTTAAEDYSATPNNATAAADPIAQKAASVRKLTEEFVSLSTGYGEHGSRAVMEVMESENLTAPEARRMVETSYELGYRNQTVDTTRLNDVQMKAYEAGKLDAAAQGQRNVATATASAVHQGGIDTSHKDSDNLYVTRLKNTQPKVYAAVDKLGKATGTRIVFDKSLRGGMSNGSYISKIGEIHIAPDAQNPVMQVVRHEVTHRMKDTAPAAYNAFREEALQVMGEGAVERMKAQYLRDSDGKVRLTTEGAMDEIAALYAEKILTDDKELGNFIEKGKQNTKNRSMVQKFFDAIHNFVAKVKSMLNDDKASQNAAAMQEFGVTIEQLERAEQLWKDALAESEQNVKAKRQGIETNAQQEYNGSNETQYALKYWKPDLNKTEWSVVNSVMQGYHSNKTWDVGEIVYGFHVKSKGEEVFGYVSTDDNTLLYASGGDNAVADARAEEAYGRYWNETNRDRKSLDRHIEELRNRKKADIGNRRNAEERRTKVGDDRLSATVSENRKRGSDQGRNHGRSEANPESELNAQYSLKGTDIQSAINQSMTMAQCKDMIQRAFVLGDIKNWHDGKYKNGDEWVRGEGAEDVALIVDNEYTLQVKYLNKIQGVMDGDFYAEDIIEAYLAGTLTGKQKTSPTKRLDLSRDSTALDDRFYAPKQIENAKATYEIAIQKLTNKNRDEVTKARADIIMFAHTRGAAEALGLTQSELNKKLSQWARYTARAREVSEKFNAGVADWNKWTGIENSNLLNKATVSNEDLERLVGNIEGDNDGYQRKYIMRTMLALDTHIDYTGLNFKFVGVPDPNRRSVNGFYTNSDRTITVKYHAPHTVAHEMGHYLDYQWARDIGLHGALTESRQGTKAVSGDVKVWHDNFMSFIDSISDVAVLQSSYTMDNKEVFARFVDRFVLWVNFTANGERDTSLRYNDKFTAKHYIEFVKLLQEKAALDSKKMDSSDTKQFSLRNQSDILKDSADRRAVNTALRRAYKNGEIVVMDKPSLQRMTKRMMDSVGSKASVKDMTERVTSLYEYIVSGENGDRADFNTAYELAYAIGTELAESAVAVEQDDYQDMKELRDVIRTTGISINKAYDHDLIGYESINEFRKANFGRIKLTKDGIPVDSFYQELASSYPGYFNESEYTTQPEQLMHIAEVLDGLKPTEYNPYEGNTAEAASWFANDLLMRIYGMQNDRIADVIIRNEEKAAKAVKRESAKRAEAVKKVRTKYKDRDLRDKIKKHINKMSKMLDNPSDTNHVPEHMRKVVANFLDVIDVSPKNIRSVTTLNRLYAMRELYQDIMNEKGDIWMDVDPDLVDNINTVINAWRTADALGEDGRTSVSDIKGNHLEALYRVVLAVERSISNYNKAFNKRIAKNIATLGDMVISENRTDKSFKEHTNKLLRSVSDTVNMDMLNPEDFFMQMGDTMKLMWKQIRSGFDTKIKHTAEAINYMAELTKGVDISVITGDNAKAKTFETSGGKIDLTPAQVMSLYLLQRQPDALDHIYEGGIKPAPVVAIKTETEKDGERKKKRTVPEVVKSYKTVKVTPKDVAMIIDSLTDEQKRIAEGVSTFFTDYTAEWGNEVSMDMYGYRKFTIENYFPIVSDRNYLKDVFGETTDSTLKNMGVTKKRQKGANNPIIIEDVFDVYTRQADQMSSYNAFVIPLADMQRIFNYQNGVSVKEVLENRYGERATKYFKKLMTDLNGGARYNGGNAMLNQLISNYKQAKMGLNLRVIAQQPSAYFRALSVLDAKYVTGALATPASANMETIFKYAPIAQWKSWGFFSMDTGKGMRSLLMGEKELADYTMWAAGKMDELTWKRLWTACELEIRDKRKDLARGSDEYYTAVGERLSEVIDRTQVVDSVLHRSQIMRNPDGLVKMSVSFMNEPMKAYNMLRSAAVEAINNPTEAAKKAIIMAAVGYMTSLVTNHLVTALVDTLRGDEDDEEWLEQMVNKVIGKDDEEKEPKTWVHRYLWHFLDNLVNEPLSMFPYAKDVVSMIQGYDVKRMDMQGLADFVNAAKRASSDKYTIAHKIIDISSKAADLFGIPASSFKREVETFAGIFLDVADSPWMDYQNAKLWNTIGKNEAMYLDILWDAYADGDMEVYDRIANDLIDRGLTPSEIRNGMRSRAKKAGISADDLKDTDISIGIKPTYEGEADDSEEKFDIDKLSGSDYIAYGKTYNRTFDDIYGDMLMHGFNRMDDDLQNDLLNAAYSYAEKTALAQHSHGQYEPDVEWIKEAQEARKSGVDIGTFIMYREGTEDMDTKVEKLEFVDRMGLSNSEYIALLEAAFFNSTEQKKVENNLRDDQIDDYAELFAEQYDEIDESLEGYRAWNSYDEETQGRVLGYAESFAREYAILQLAGDSYIPSKIGDTTVGNIKLGLARGLTEAEIFEGILMKNSLEGLKDKYGETITNSKKDQFIAWMQKKGYSRNKQKAMLLAVGYSTRGF